MEVTSCASVTNAGPYCPVSSEEDNFMSGSIETETAVSGTDSETILQNQSTADTTRRSEKPLCTAGTIKYVFLRVAKFFSSLFASRSTASLSASPTAAEAWTEEQASMEEVAAWVDENRDALIDSLSQGTADLPAEDTGQVPTDPFADAGSRIDDSRDALIDSLSQGATDSNDDEEEFEDPLQGLAMRIDEQVEQIIRELSAA